LEEEMRGYLGSALNVECGAWGGGIRGEVRTREEDRRPLMSPERR
jgi:hypothetical protein